MKPIQRLEERRKRRFEYARFPQFAVDALQVATQFVLPEDRADWPDGILYAITKIDRLRPEVVKRLGREPTIGELAVHYLAVRAAEQSQLNALLSGPGTQDNGQSVQDPGNNPPQAVLDQDHAEQGQEVS